jgi:hypothetical protein
MGQRTGRRLRNRRAHRHRSRGRLDRLRDGHSCRAGCRRLSAPSAIRDYFDGKASGPVNPFANYEQQAERGKQVIQDMIDCFWEYPLIFQRMADQTHCDEIIDCFAGRLYQDDDHLSDAVQTLRRLRSKQRDRAIAA